MWRYLNGVVAAMYVRSEDGVLRRIGAYGFAHDDTDTRPHRPAGESLAAQAANQNRIVRCANCRRTTSRSARRWAKRRRAKC
jgi:hypothetical protein